MTRVRAVAVGILVLALAQLSPATTPQRASVSPAIFPPQDLPLNFSHRTHIADHNVDCDECHEQAPSSQSSLDNLIPTEEACTDCHAIDRKDPNKASKAGDAPAACVTCHPGFDEKTGFVARVNIPPPNIKFSHKAHIDRNVACSACHGDLVKEGVDVATRAQLPAMATCLDCHRRTGAATRCSTCHLSEGGGLLKTDFASGALVPSGSLRGAAHTLSFRGNHKAAAQNDDEFCGSCHKRDFCVECHNGVVKPMDFHVGDYVSMHAVEARRNQPDCSSCHRRQTFCVGCHARSGVVADGRGSEFAEPLTGLEERRFHPVGWVGYGNGLSTQRGPKHHSFEAQRNIRSCASCHRETFCITCHSRQTGSFSINPHPRTWMGSRRCEALRKRAGRMCLRCHIDAQELSCTEPMR
jgi:hypothetical protein